jgi:hypothetical protein
MKFRSDNGLVSATIYKFCYRFLVTIHDQEHEEGWIHVYNLEPSSSLEEAHEKILDMGIFPVIP